MADSIETTAPQFLTKQPAEKRLLSFDFTAWLDSDQSETLSSPTISSELVSGETSDLVITGLTTSSSLKDDGLTHQYVTFYCEGGTHAQNYRIECTINTSLGQILEADGMLRVLDK